MKLKNLGVFSGLLGMVLIVFLGVSTAYAAPDSPPTLKLVKAVITDDGGTAIPDDWELFASWSGGSDGFSNLGGSGIFEQVPVDTEITLSESEYPAGYNPSEWSCNGGEIVTDPTTGILVPNKIKLSTGDKVTCTITNDDVAPTLKLIKKVINTNGDAVPDDWTLSATASTPNAKRNFTNLGGQGVDEPIFANALYFLSESGGNLAYTSLNDGKWNCTLTYPNGDELVISRPISGISLKEGDSAVCSITNVQDSPSISIITPSKIKGKLTISAEVKGFEMMVPVSYKVYKLSDAGKSIVYEGYVTTAPYSFSISGNILDAGSTYEITANTNDGNGKSASNSAMIQIPPKGK